jgi:cytochrome c
MLKTHFRNLISALMIASIFFISPAFAGKKEDAVSLVQKGIAFYKKNGEAKTMSAINDKHMFQKGDLYLWVIRSDSKNKAMVVAHGTNKTIPGKEWYNVKDPDGKYFIHEICDIAKTKGNGWVEYRWAHPKLKKAKPKVTYLERVNDLIFMCGYYKVN